ncbi:MAG: FAD-dependent oxidoreductase [Arthrobacter sp.]|uniref:NAD(P)/FAD-dependent oxidoreductase n=1 Tax=Arthrobacter sp. TaxID=1667 RepID=UPI00348D4401
MSAESSHTVVVGAGLAAAHTVQALREGGYAGSITLIGDEPVPPYERPPLSKEYLQGRKKPAEVFVHDAAWYAERGIDARWGTRAAGIDRDARTVRLASGEEVPYTRLVLATGATPRTLDVPGASLPGVHTLRRIGDADALRAAFDTGGRLAIVGAGWIGLEVASSARQAGLEVTVVAPNAVPLEAALGPEIGRYFAELHRRNGTDLRMNTSVTGILEANGRAAGLATDAGEVWADLVLVAVGAAPETALAAAAGLEVDNGVVVDARLRTRDPSVLAAGDVANAEHASLGRLRVEHWDNAIRQGKLAAATILADSVPDAAADAGGAALYDWLPYFFTDQYDVGMEYVGRAGRATDVVVRGDPDSGEFIAFWTEEGRVAAAMNVNIWDVGDVLRGIVGREVPRERLADAGVGLEDL